MISTSGLELTNFLNPELTWKTVAKGNRSATRRTRKPVGRNLNMFGNLADKNGQRMTEDTAVSASEKLGVAVLGRRFSDELEHVPIKKRKFNFRAPSPPPPQTPSHIEVVEHAFGQVSCTNSDEKRLLLACSGEPGQCVDKKSLDSLKEKLDYREDFSGIEILAAAACGNSLDADVDHPEVKPAVEGVIQENNSEEALAEMKMTNCSLRETYRTEDSSVQDTTDTFVQSSSDEKDNKTLERSVPSRIHWDLNIVMDAWEEPCKAVTVGSEINDVEGTLRSGEQHILEGCETQSETINLRQDNLVDVLVSSGVPEKTNTCSDFRGLANGSDREDSQLAACHGLDPNLEECDADPKVCTQAVSLDSQISVACTSNVMSNSSLPSYLEEKKDVSEEKIVPAECAQLEKYDVASLHVPVIDRVCCKAEKTILNENSGDLGGASCVKNDVNTKQDMISLKNSELLDPVMVEPASKAEEVGLDHPSPKCEDVATSIESSKEVQPVVTKKVKGETDSSLHDGSEELMHTPCGTVAAMLDTGYGLTNEETGFTAPSNSACKIKFEESCDDTCVSDTSQDDKVHVVRMENSRELQDGYESQFEDGELREPDARCWEVNNCESEDIEQVDYESECDGEKLSIFGAEDIDNKRKFESGSSLGSGVVTEKSEQGAIGDAFGDSLLSSEGRNLESGHENKLEKDTAACEELSGKDFTSTMVGARPRRELLSCTKGSLSSNDLQRCGSNNCDDLCPRSERESDPNSRRDRFSLHMRHRSPGGGHIVNTHQSHSYHGPYESGRPTPRSVVENRGFVMASDRTMFEASGGEGFNSRVRRQYMSSSSNSVCEEFNGKHFTSTMVGARPRREFVSCSQGSLSSNAVQRSNNFDDLSPRLERESDPNSRFMARDRFSLNMRHQSPGGGHIVYTCQSPPYHGPYGSGRPRPRNVESRGFEMDSDRSMFEATGCEGFDSRVRRQYLSSSSNSVYRPINRRPPVGCRDDIYTGTAPIRDDMSPDRRRFRRYPPGIGRGFREDYRRPMPNYPAEDHMPQRMGRRKRSTSPLSGERPHYVKKPQSRSRSRSPSSWFSMRDRNEISRRRSSRSPDFRSTRINRARAPFKRRFEVEYEEGFMSPPRNRFSPQRNPPRFDDRISGLDNFRGRKSPVRIFRQGQRFDSSCPFRPMMPPRRFPDIGSGAGRGYKCEGADHDDRRKLGNRFEVHRVRHYDNDDDGVRRLRYNDNNNPDESFL